MTLKTRWQVFYVLVAVLVLGVFASYQHPDAIPPSRAPAGPPNAARAASKPETRADCLQGLRLAVAIKETQQAGVSLDDEITQVWTELAHQNATVDNLTTFEQARRVVVEIYTDGRSPGEEKAVYIADCDDRFPVLP